MTSDSTIFTIGLYGFNELEFFSILKTQHIDVFIDIRARRGVRGRRYPFANAKRLMAALKEAEIDYIHLPNFAPFKELRKFQTASDAGMGMKKSERQTLTEEFVAGYNSMLRDSDLLEFSALVANYHRICLFCIERPPAACHRSLLADELHRRFGMPVIHLWGLSTGVPACP